MAGPIDRPLDDRSNALKIPVVILIAFSSIFVLLRLVVSARKRNFFLLTDHLLWTGHVLAIGGAVATYKTAAVGGGRHMWDPIMTPEHLKEYLWLLWIGQLLNLYGMTLVKLSICAYIFMLSFSKGFKIVIWISAILHVSMNFVFPTIILFGECTPVSRHWNLEQAGSCWSTKPKVISGYACAAANILTDLVFTLAPLIYISRVQLPKRTIWGVRMVFLLGLLTTTLSALKLYEVRSLNDSPDPTYTAVNLSIYAMAEVFVAVFTACLPPLRKTFDTMLHQMLPNISFVATPGQTHGSHELRGGSNRSVMDRVSALRKGSDADSDHAFLENRDGGKELDIEILKTTQVSVEVDDQTLESRRDDDWV